MQSYDEIVNSGTDWLGYVPAQWSIRRGKFMYQNKKVVNKSMAETQRLALTLRGVIERKDGDNLGLNPESLESYQIFEKNDLVFKLIDLENKQTSRVGLTPKRGIMSPAYIRLTPKLALSPKYFFYYYYSLYLTYVFNNIAGEGVRANLSAKELLELPAPVPSLQTQQKIADFLDAETAKIDNLIAKQERLLELLEEKRRATITHAVTRGLNPSVELKETNIPWLGQIPVHWGVVRLKSTISDQRNGIWGAEPDGGEDDIVCIRVADFDRGNLSVADKKFTKRSIDKKDQRERLLSKGDLLFEKSGGGDNQLVGQIVKFDLDIPAVTSNFVAKLTVNPGYNVDFLVYLHAALYYQRVNYRSIKQTSGIQNIDSQAYFDEKVAIPMWTEQEEIAMHLAKEDKKVAKLKQKIQTQITLLRERRTSLISHAVTGKIKV